MRSCKGLLLKLQIGMKVDLGGFDRLVSEPQGDHAAIHALLEQLHRGRVPQCVRRDPSIRKGGTASSCAGDVFFDETLECILAHTAAATTGENRRVGLRWKLTQPGLEDRCNVAAKRRAAQLSSLADAADVGTGPQRHILATKRRQLRDTQTRLDSDE